MYVILTKNGDNTWDAIHQLDPYSLADTSVIDAAFDTGLPVVGMNASLHKTSAGRGSVWDGNSFVGGNVNTAAPIDQEYLDGINRYVFLSNNEVVFSITVAKNSANIELFDAAFDGETILIKTETGPLDKVGKTFNWDGRELTLV
jgi:hypothetical protein